MQQLPPQMPQQQQQYPIIQQSQPLSADLVEKILDDAGLIKNLNHLLYHAEEIKTKEPIYETRVRPKLSTDGKPMMDAEGNLIKEEFRQKVGEIERPKFIPFFEPHTPMVNISGLFEIRNMVIPAATGAVMTSSFRDIDLEETAKDIAESICRMLIVRHKQYDFQLSTSVSINLFKDLALAIAGALNRSRNEIMLNLIANTHDVKANASGNLPQQEGFFQKFKRMATN